MGELISISFIRILLCQFLTLIKSTTFQNQICFINTTSKNEKKKKNLIQLIVNKIYFDFRNKIKIITIYTYKNQNYNIYIYYKQENLDFFKYLTTLLSICLIPYAPSLLFSYFLTTENLVCYNKRKRNEKPSTVNRESRELSELDVNLKISRPFREFTITFLLTPKSQKIPKKPNHRHNSTKKKTKHNQTGPIVKATDHQSPISDRSSNSKVNSFLI